MKTKIKKKLALLLTFITILCSLTGCDKTEKNSDTSKNISETPQGLESVDTDFDEKDLDVGYDEAKAVIISLNGASADISGNGAVEKDNVLTISSEGTYVLSGEYTGRIIVNTDKNSDVRLVFKNATVNCEDNAPLFIQKADKVYITLAEGSDNSLSDGKSYNLGADDSNVDGAVFSRADLTLNGSGKLTVTANYQHAIVCKDDLVITDGEYDITSASGGIYGKDSIKIKQGKFNITSGSNAIKSSNTEESGKGNIYIEGGSFNINASNDGIESAISMLINGGDFNITTGGGSENASIKENGQPNEKWGKWDRGFMGSDMQSMEHPDGQDGSPPQMPDNNMAFEQTSNDSAAQSDSAKALKAQQVIKINGGTFVINSSDDSVHCNGDIVLAGGDVTLSSGDDGVHADGNLLITDGKINVEKSYEGLEGVTVTINGGDISVVASDDGINAGGGSDTGSTDRMGRDSFNSSSNYLLTVSGGKIKVNASGDGVDSNGNFIMEGGELYVSGPTNNGNSAIDYGDGASAWVTGGTIIACGSSGMAEAFSEDNSTQYSVLHNFNSTISGGTEVKITDSNGYEILSYTPEKDFQSITFSCSELKEGTYSIFAGDISEEISISSIVTSNGSFGGMGAGGMFGKGRM